VIFTVRSDHTCAEARQVRKGSTAGSFPIETLEKAAVQPLAQQYRQRKDSGSAAVGLDIHSNCIQLIPCLIFLTNSPTSLCRRPVVVQDIQPGKPSWKTPVSPLIATVYN